MVTGTLNPDKEQGGGEAVWQQIWCRNAPYEMQEQDNTEDMRLQSYHRHTGAL